MSKLTDTFNRPRWAEGAVVYQIYPRSFQDSNNDGIGDLQGVIQRLDYLQKLGISAIWFSPFYPSPMADFGYDVADYCNIDPMFGTLKDFKQLLRAAHKLNIKIMVDIVPNHSSDEHPWFKESVASPKGTYGDWYIWRDPIRFDNGTPLPPNNWLDMFSGDSAWKWVPERQQFYLHSFHYKQPDLNWENPAVRRAMKDVLRFWLNLGVDGFRVDAVPFMDKHPDLADDPADPFYDPHHHSPTQQFKRSNSQGWPRLYDYLNELSSVLKEPRYRQHPRFMVTEGYVDRDNAVENYLKYFRAMDSTVAAPFIFEGIEQSLGAVTWRKFLREFHEALDAHSPYSLPAYAFGNHDQSRLATRFGSERARAAAVLQMTLPGMTFVYNGDELGMHDVHIPPEYVQDPQALAGAGRDRVRTPMQWTAAEGAGFTYGSPWLPFAHDYKTHNVATESKDPKSFLSLYRALIHLRTTEAAFRSGKLTLLHNKDPQVLAYERSSRRKRYIVVVNFQESPAILRIERHGEVIISSIDGATRKKLGGDAVHLRAHEAVVIKCS